MPKEIIPKLQQILQNDQILTEPKDLQFYGKDWTDYIEPNPLAIVFPITTQQVKQIIDLANEMKFHIVPSGGRTGLSGGAVAGYKEVVLALDKMNRLIDLNKIDRTLTCEAGRITEQIQNDASEAGYFYPVDFASAGSSQIGGNVSTNAGGIKVIRYGMTREWVAGLKVVTGSGEILELNKGLIKNATGYDLRQLFIGAEGTLGIITEVTLKLTKAPLGLTVLVLGVERLTHIIEVLKTFQNQFNLTAFEFFSEAALNKVIAHHHLKRPFETQTEYYVLIEFENINESTETQAYECFEKCVEDGWVIDGTLSQSQQQFEMLWALRERISETISSQSPYKNDISVMPSKIPEFLNVIDKIVSQNYPHFEVIWFGHIGDGNVHLNILKPKTLSLESFVSSCEEVNRLIFEQVEHFQGSISAEHGIGTLKKPYLKFSKSEHEINLMKSIRKVFDPNQILNPGKLWDAN